MRIGYFKMWLLSLLGIGVNRNLAYIDADTGLYYFYPNPNESVSESAKMGQKTITGTVTDETSEPVVGVNILIENTSKRTVTDIDGKYSIEVNVGDILVYSHDGFRSHKILVEEGMFNLGQELKIIKRPFSVNEKTIIGIKSTSKGFKKVYGKEHTEKDRLIAKWKKEFATEIIPYDEEYLYKKAMIEKYDREFPG